MTDYDVIIIGAGAAGFICAIEAGKRGRRVWLIDHSKKIAEKIRISGGGRCNFTNIHASPANYLSKNPHFCKSALKQYTQHDFIGLVNKHGITHHEKTLGQLFCDHKSQDIIDMLLKELKAAGVKHQQETSVETIDYRNNLYHVATNYGTKTAPSLVIATGGLSIPKIGATNFGYKIAQQFGHNIVQTRAGLVPLTFQAALLEQCKALSGLSVDALVTYEKKTFREGLLFTHRGLSGPSILQISSYWQEGKPLTINLCPAHNIQQFIEERRTKNPKQQTLTALSDILPKRLAQQICTELFCDKKTLSDLSNTFLQQLTQRINSWTIKPQGTEGYRTAEVTLGGVDTNELSSKTMESKLQPGLFFIGEVIDVTGHLGGYNFQWAWSSGYVAGQNV